ncbi:rhomboid family intramembrane serine protease [Kitasatospora sp. NBC_01250]|uniref:rhomboid family intramembrane serine protease n=1 Tax=unclassified Kitasatospora TaxID=2633591 RepID=UPI002E111326|nr:MULTISPECIES: rhomboid family intramembrane serine protease [unclassified Kitasatospora]WSJ69872.1 rhomboid family intramembrane serine protease [Kitasatospora sp. NBC_01302]
MPLPRPAWAQPPDGGPVPVVTCLLIALNCLVFLAGPSGINPHYGTGAAVRACAAQHYQQRWGAIPVELLSNRPLTQGRLATLTAPVSGCPLLTTPHKIPALSALSSLFVHGGWLHLLGNMLFLYVFGADVEERLGRVRFLLFYLTVGALAAYGYAAACGHGTESLRPLVGASGAIAGVLGGYLRLYPRARVTALVPLLFFLPLRFPAWLVLGLWFAVQWWSVHQAGPGVAYLAHVIGFSAGFLALWVLGRRAGYPGPTLPQPSPGGTPSPGASP